MAVIVSTLSALIRAPSRGPAGIRFVTGAGSVHRTHPRQAPATPQKGFLALQIPITHVPTSVEPLTIPLLPLCWPSETGDSGNPQVQVFKLQEHLYTCMHRHRGGRERERGRERKGGRERESGGRREEAEGARLSKKKRRHRERDRGMHIYVQVCTDREEGGKTLACTHFQPAWPRAWPHHWQRGEPRTPPCIGWASRAPPSRVSAS